MTNGIKIYGNYDDKPKGLKEVNFDSAVVQYKLNEDLQRWLDEKEKEGKEYLERLFEDIRKKLHELTLMTNKTYDRIIASSENPAACLSIYMHLVRTARRQKTNTVWADKKYIQNGLKIGYGTVKRVMAELHRMGLIEYSQGRREESGTFEKNYVIVKYIPSTEHFTGGTFTALPVDRTTGFDTQMLKEDN